MKRLFQRTTSALLLALMLACSVHAAGGLDAFSDSRTMTADTFSDVSASDWFYNGVKNVYDMNLMDGMGNGVFAPGQTVPWSQAVTIAARVRAAYYGETIPAVGGPWYAPYVAYAQSCGILPANHPEGDAWNTTPIDRQSIAYLFQAMVKPEDFPVISNLAIPDLDFVSPDKRSAVQFLYSSGVLTGKEGGRFDPTGLTTRGELACLLTNLLRPAYRTALDDRVNAEMNGQESNFVLGGGICYDDKATYMIYRETGEGEREHILRRDEKSGEVTTLYSTGDETWKGLARLSICEGWLYFIENGENYSTTLRRLSLSTGETEDFCSASKDNGIDFYTIYDGRIFTVQSKMVRSGSSYEFRYTVGEAVNGSIRTLLQQTRVDEIYGFNGKLYIDLNAEDTIISYDLETGKTETLLESVSVAAMTGGKIYYSLWENGEYTNQIWMASLHATDAPVKYGTVPDSALELYVNLNHDGANLYYLASSTYTLYRIIPGQQAQQVLRTRFSTVEKPIIWKDRFLAGNLGLSQGTNYVGEYPLTTNMGSASSFTSNVDDWLGCSALMKKVDFPATSAIYTNSAMPTAEQNIVVRRAYYSGNKLILDLDYYNPHTEKSHMVSSIDLTVMSGSNIIAQAHLIDMEQIRPGTTFSFTAVIQGDDLFAEHADLSALTWQASASYNAVRPT